MNLIEIMKAKGISDDIIKAVQDDMKANKIFTTMHENMDIRYPKLKEQHDTLTNQYGESTKLIEDLQKSNKGNEALQGQITEYQTRMQQLEAELAEAKMDSAIDVGLLAAGVKPDDVDYIKFKLKAKGELELDEQGKVKGWDDKVAGLKTQFPANFVSTGGKTYEEHKLASTDESGGKAVTKEEFNKMGYGSRVGLKQNNPELYAQLMKG